MIQRFVRITLFALIVSAIGCPWSVFANSTKFIIGGGRDVQFTAASRFVVICASVYCTILAVGFFYRSRRSWRAAFALPASIITVAVVVSWPRLHSDRTFVIPILILIGVGVWQSMVWRRQWAACESYFTAD